MMNSFWWGTKQNGDKRIHWLKWERMCSSKDQGGLGFRILHVFNLAMLAKQGWNFIHCPTSLPSQIYKAKYFPRNGFLDANEGYNPSFIWRSVLQARRLLEVGIRWRVGNGDGISVWNDPWLTNVNNFYIRSPILEGMEDLRVKDLISDDGRSWDLQMIRGIFCDVDVKEILKIPLSRTNVLDRQIWNFSHDGVYTVRSGYKAGIANLYPSEPYLANAPWKKIWKLSIPPKVKEFIWRACRGIIPTCDSLYRRGAFHGDGCVVCRAHEDITHALLHCHRSRACWALLNQNPIHINFIDFLNNLFQVSNEDVSKACMVAWSIWDARNSLLWQNRYQHPNYIVNKALKALNEWRNAKNLFREPAHNVLHQNIVTHWTPPPVGFFKCNIDASLQEADGISGFGIVVRDETGSFIGCATGYHDAVYEPLLAEMIAFREALSWMKHKGFNMVIFETDCLQMVQRFDNSEDGINEIGVILSDCKFLATTFQAFSLAWTNRQANMVAHHLARRAHHYPNPTDWNLPPDFVRPFITSDVNCHVSSCDN